MSRAWAGLLALALAGCGGEGVTHVPGTTLRGVMAGATLPDKLSLRIVRPGPTVSQGGPIFGLGGGALL